MRDAPAAGSMVRPAVGRDLPTPEPWGQPAPPAPGTPPRPLCLSLHGLVQRTLLWESCLTVYPASADLGRDGMGWMDGWPSGT